MLPVLFALYGLRAPLRCGASAMMGRMGHLWISQDFYYLGDLPEVQKWPRVLFFG